MKAFTPAPTSFASFGFRFSRRTCRALLALALLGATSAFGQVTWTGVAGDGIISTQTNWSAGFSPSSVTDVVFGIPSTNVAQTITIGGSFPIRDLTFSGASRPAYTFAGTGSPTLTIYGNVAVNSSSASPADVTFGNTLALALSAGAHTADVGNAIYLTVNGVVKDSDGASSIVKAGGGTLVLAGANTFTGTTTINNGYVSIGADSGLGTAPASATAGSLTLNGGALAVTSSFALNANRGIAVGANGGALNVGTGLTLTYGGVIAGSGALALQTGGTLVLTGANTYNGTFSNIGSILQIGDGGTAGSFAGDIVNSGALIFNSGKPLDSSSVYSGQISGSGTLEKKGTGSTTFTGNVAPGSTTVSAGFLNIGFGGTTGSLTGNVTLSGTGQLQFIRSDAYTFNGNITGTGNLATYGGPLTLGGANTFGGNTFVAASLTGSASSLTDSVAGAYSPNSTLRVQTGATVNVTQNEAVAGLNNYSATPADNNGSVVLASGKTLTIGNGATNTFAGVISGSGSLAKKSAGTLNLTGANTYTGSTTINDGTLALTGGSLAAATVLNLAPSAGTTASFNLGAGQSQAIAALNFSGSASTSLSAISIGTGSTLTLNGDVAYSATNNPGAASISGGTLALGASRIFTIGNSTSTSAELTVGSVISGAGFSLTKSGSGTLTLSGANTYSGGTNITAGTLALGASNVLPNNTVTIGAGTLSLGSFSDTIGALALGGAAGTASVTGTGTLTLGGDVTYDATNNPGGATVSANLALGSAARTFTVGNSTSATNDLTVSGNVTGSGSITKAGAGTLQLSGANNAYTGGTTMNAGVLIATDATSLGTNAGALTLAGGEIQFANNSNTTFTGTNTRVTGNATLTPDRSSTLSSGVTHALGTLSIGSQTLTVARGSHISGSDNIGDLVFGATTLTGSPTFNVAASTDLALGTISGANSDNFAYGFTKQGLGSLTLKGSFNGPLTSTAGSISLASTGARGGGTWMLTDTTVSVDVTATGNANAPFRGSSTIATTFSGASSLLAKTNYAVSGGTQTFSGTSVFTASGDHVITGGIQVFNSPDNPLGMNVASDSFASQLTALSDTDIGNDVLPFTARLTVDRFSSDTTIMGGTQTFTGYASLQANHKGAIGTGSTSTAYFNDDTHLRASKANAIMGGTQVFSGSAFLWAKTTDATTTTTGAVNGGVQIFRACSSLIADSINSVTGGNQSFYDSAGLNANIAGAVTGVTLNLWDQSYVDVNAANALSATTNLSFNGPSVQSAEDNGSGQHSLLSLAMSGGQLALFANTTVGSLNSATSGAGAIALNGNTLTTASNASTSFSGTISGGVGAKLVKQGSGTLEVAGANPDFRGIAQVDAGTLRLLGSFDSTSVTNVNAGGTIAGTGTLGTLSLTGGIVAPGNPVGTLTAGATTFGASGHYAWDLTNATGVAGTGWDTLAVNGTLTISATTDHPFVFDLSTLNGGSAGLATNFNLSFPYNFAVVNATSIVGFNPAVFQVNTAGFQNALGGGQFSLSSTGTQLMLNFTPVPEPSTWALLLSGLGVVALGARRRLRRR